MRLRVQPRASRDAILGWREPGVLGVRVTAPPVEGDANRAVGMLLAKALGLSRSAVTIVRGMRGRDKLARISGLTREDVRSRLERMTEDAR